VGRARSLRQTGLACRVGWVVTLHAALPAFVSRLHGLPDKHHPLPLRGDTPTLQRDLCEPQEAVGLAVAAALWIVINGPVAGPVLLELTPDHGLHVADLPSLVALVTAGLLFLV